MCLHTVGPPITDVRYGEQPKPCFTHQTTPTPDPPILDSISGIGVVHTYDSHTRHVAKPVGLICKTTFL